MGGARVNKGKKGGKGRERGKARKLGRKEREQEVDTRHTNPSLLPAPLTAHAHKLLFRSFRLEV